MKVYEQIVIQRNNPDVRFHRAKAQSRPGASSRCLGKARPQQIKTPPPRTPWLRVARLHSRHALKVSGFTVAEVALALAVVAFGLVAVLGVLPIGLNSTRDNRDETIITQDIEYWMNAIRGGPLGLDAFNHVEWVEIHQGDKRYRAEYAKLRIDGYPDSDVTAWPDYIDENGKKTIPPLEYRGTLKQSSWRKDVIGWLTAPSGSSRTNYAKIIPLGGTLMNRLHTIKDVNLRTGKSYYLHEGGGLAFSYLLKTEISKVLRKNGSVITDFWKIKMTAKWPIIKENVVTGVVDTGPGKLVSVSYINASLPPTVDPKDLNSLPAVSSGPMRLSLSGLLSIMPADEAIGRDELRGFLKSSLGQMRSGAGGLGLANGKIPSELLNALGASSPKDLTARLAGAEANADFMKSLKGLLERNGIMAGESSDPGLLSSILGGLNSDRSKMQQIKASVGSGDPNFGQLMNQLDRMQSHSELFGNLRSSVPNAGNLDQLLAQLMSNNQLLKGLGIDAGNIGQLGAQLGQLEANSKLINQLMGQFGGEEKSMENVKTQLRQREANGNVMNQVDALLASNGKSRSDLAGLLAANETDIKANNMINRLLDSGLKGLEESRFLNAVEGGGYMPTKIHESYGRYSLRSLKKDDDGKWHYFTDMWYFRPSLDED